MSETSQADLQRLYTILMPYAANEIQRVSAESRRFVHYTSAEAAMAIIRSGSVWLRNALLMNDFSEVEHGQRCLYAAYKLREDGGRRFHAVMAALGDTFGDRLEKAINSRSGELQTESYLISLSEHGVDSNEDDIGRLSMWRAYGGAAGVALVVHNTPFITPSEVLGAYTSPVLYSDEVGFKAHFEQLVAGLEANLEFLKGIDVELVLHTVMEAFQFAMLSTKHPGFHEEREWRVIYTPKFRASDKILAEIQSVRGIPQQIYKIPLRDHPAEGLTGLAIPNLLDRVIIGPTQYPWPIWTAFVELLREVGVEKPETRVHISGVPLRQ